MTGYEREREREKKKGEYHNSIFFSNWAILFPKTIGNLFFCDFKCYFFARVSF